MLHEVVENGSGMEEYYYRILLSLEARVRAEGGCNVRDNVTTTDILITVKLLYVRRKNRYEETQSFNCPLQYYISTSIDTLS